MLEVLVIHDADLQINVVLIPSMISSCSAFFMRAIARHGFHRSKSAYRSLSHSTAVGVARVDMRLPTYAKTARCVERVILPGLGRKVFGSSALIRIPPHGRERELLLA